MLAVLSLFLLACSVVLAFRVCWLRAERDDYRADWIATDEARKGLHAELAGRRREIEALKGELRSVRKHVGETLSRVNAQSADLADLIRQALDDPA